MKRIILTTGLIGSLLTAVVATSISVAAAQQPQPLSQEHRNRVVGVCMSAKTSLTQLHRSDASMRVNRGQTYEYITTKLMSRFNGRLAMNRFDNTALVAASNTFNQRFDEFRDSYQVYETAMSSLLRIDCTKQPDEFYYAVIDVRERRSLVANSVVRVNEAIDQYYSAYQAFVREYHIALKEVQGNGGI